MARSAVSDRLLDYNDVADRLNVSVRTVERLVKDGKLRATKVLRSVRFRPADIDDFIEAQTGYETPAPAPEPRTRGKRRTHTVPTGSAATHGRRR